MSRPTGQAMWSNCSAVGDFLFQKLFAHDARLAAAANHAQKNKRLMNPLGQHQRVMLMAARDDEAERGRFRQRHFQKLMPAADPQLHVGRKKLVVRQFRPVVENGHGKIELQRERRDGLRDVAGTGNPQVGRRRNGFLIKPFEPLRRRVTRSRRDGKIFFHAPADRSGDGGEFAPEFRRFRRARQNQSAHAAAANQSVVPAEIVVEHHVERGGLAGLQGFYGARVDFGFETAAAERADDFSVGKKQRLGADALRAGAFRAGNQREHERLFFRQRGGKLFVKSGHGNFCWSLVLNG